MSTNKRDFATKSHNLATRWRFRALFIVQIENLAYFHIHLFELMTSNVICCAQNWDNFHQVRSRSTCPFLTITFYCWYDCLTLWPWTLTHWPWTSLVSAVTWSNSVPHLTEIEQSATELLRYKSFWAPYAPSWILPEVDLHNSEAWR